MGATQDLGNTIFVALTRRVWTLHLLCVAGRRFDSIRSRHWWIALLRSKTVTNLSVGNSAVPRRSCFWNCWALAAQSVEMVRPCLRCGDAPVLVLCRVE